MSSFVQDNQLQGRVQAVEFTWGRDCAPLGPPFDLVLASDVAYSSAAVPALLTSLADLARGATAVWYAFEERPPVTDQALQLMPQYGLTFSEVSAPKPVQFEAVHGCGTWSEVSFKVESAIFHQKMAWMVAEAVNCRLRQHTLCQFGEVQSCCAVFATKGPCA